MKPGYSQVFIVASATSRDFVSWVRVYSTGGPQGIGSHGKLRVNILNSAFFIQLRMTEF